MNIDLDEYYIIPPLDGTRWSCLVYFGMGHIGDLTVYDAVTHREIGSTTLSWVANNAVSLGDFILEREIVDEDAAAAS